MSNVILRVAAIGMMASVLTVSIGARETVSRVGPSQRLLLHVSAYGDVPAQRLSRAQQQVLTLFSRIGVGVEWIGCGLDRLTGDGSPSLSVDVAVVAGRSRALTAISPGVLGAVVRNVPAGETAWVMFDRVEHASDQFALDTGIVLGHAIAHEVGHLLLPRGTHGARGLMRASWRMEDLRDAVQGQLGFSESEASLILERLRQAARGTLH